MRTFCFQLKVVVSEAKSYLQQHTITGIAAVQFLTLIRPWNWLHCSVNFFISPKVIANSDKSFHLSRVESIHVEFMAQFLSCCVLLVENMSHLEHHCSSFEMKNFNEHINHVSDNTSWHGRYGNFKRFLHSIRRKNENLLTKEADISILFVSASLSLILWQQAAAKHRNTFENLFHSRFRTCIEFSRLVVDFKQLCLWITQEWFSLDQATRLLNLQRAQGRFNGKRANACMCENTVNNKSI